MAAGAQFAADRAHQQRSRLRAAPPQVKTESRISDIEDS
jgi:hypothetical protein